MKSLLVTEKSILTAREVEYLSMVAFGFKNRMIADILFVSKSTVKKTLENIFKDLNAKDRANAVAIAFVHEIITPESLETIAKKYNLFYF